MAVLDYHYWSSVHVHLRIQTEWSLVLCACGSVIRFQMKTMEVSLIGHLASEATLTAKEKQIKQRAWRETQLVEKI